MLKQLSYGVRFGLLVTIFIGCGVGIFATAVITQTTWILGTVGPSLIVVPSIAAWLLMGEDRPA